MKIASLVTFLFLFAESVAFSNQNTVQMPEMDDGPSSGGLSFTWSGGMGSSNGRQEDEFVSTTSGNPSINTSLMLSGHSGRFEIGAIADGYIGLESFRDQLSIFYGGEATWALIDTSKRRLQFGLRAGWANVRAYAGGEYSGVTDYRYRFGNWAVGPVMRFNLGNASQSSLGFYVSALYCFGEKAIATEYEDFSGINPFPTEVSSVWLASAGLSWRLGL